MRVHPGRTASQGAVALMLVLGLSCAASAAGQDCGPRPPSTSSRDLKERQLWRLANLQHELCSSGSFQGPAAAKWSELKTRLEGSHPGPERERISQDIDQFASEFLYNDPLWKRREMDRQETQRREAQRQATSPQQKDRAPEKALAKKESRAEANLDTTRCQPEVNSPCEQLMRRLLRLQQAFLQTKTPSRIPPLKELVAIGVAVRASRSREELRSAEQALDAWKQRHLPTVSPAAASPTTP